MTQPHDLRRRSFLSKMVLLLPLGSGAASADVKQLALTPSRPMGPFYPPDWSANPDNDLLTAPGKSKRAGGIPLYLSGTVRDPSGVPIAGANMRIWQADEHGHYRHPDDTEPGPRDLNFQGYGETATDANGTYGFRGIRPVPYSWRRPHIHFRISAPGVRALVTEIYVAGEDQYESLPFLDRIGMTRKVQQLSVQLSPAPDKEPGALATRFDFVVART